MNAGISWNPDFLPSKHFCGHRPKKCTISEALIKKKKQLSREPEMKKESKWSGASVVVGVVVWLRFAKTTYYSPLAFEYLTNKTLVWCQCQPLFGLPTRYAKHSKKRESGKDCICEKGAWNLWWLPADKSLWIFHVADTKLLLLWPRFVAN